MPCSPIYLQNYPTLAQVIPFLVLAIGVDNMFILAHTLAQHDVNLPLPERMGAALAAAGPSISLAACCEVVAFALGALTPMPAVRNFSAVAAVAVALDFLLQVGSPCTGCIIARDVAVWHKVAIGSASRQARRGCGPALCNGPYWFSKSG